MEIPADLQSLYKHWDKHLIFNLKPELGLKTIDPALKSELEYFIDERLAVWQKKNTNQPRPYTDDAILDSYRFCNIYRELDAQTISFHIMLKHLEDDFSLWLLNMFYCRFVARPETTEKTGLLSFDPKQNKKVFEILSGLPSPKYGTPYVFPISTIMRSKSPTRELFITKHVPAVIQKIASQIKNWDEKSVFDGVKEILPIFGFNHRFLWTEVLIDVSYQYPEYINLFDKFPIGPGSAPTMDRIDSSAEPSILVRKLSHSRFNLKNLPTINGKSVPLSAENWEGIGCEFRKYTNLSNGRGRKRRY